MSENFSFHFEPPINNNPITLLLMHGTGGNEHDLIPLARQSHPEAACLSPRGQVSEGGALRFFRRFAEGVLDLDDWRLRSLALAAFVREQCKAHKRNPANLIALGYSNGANAAQGLLLLAPETLAGAILVRPMFVTELQPVLSLAGKRLLLLCGTRDPLMNPGDPDRLMHQYSQRGADVSLQMSEAGHHLVRQDIAAIQAFLNV